MHPEPRRCVAPLDGERVCGEPATTERVVEGLVCALCAEHAAELDQESAIDGDPCPPENRRR